MRDQKIHVIGVCCAEEARDEETDFIDVAERAQVTFAERSLIATIPPPERDIRIALLIDNGLDHMLSRSLDRCFGLAFEFETLTSHGALRLNIINALDGLLSRLMIHNNRLRHYGVKILVYAPVEIDRCMELDSFLRSWCQSTQAAHNVPVFFDIARNEAQFDHVLEGEHLRMVHGDIKAQFAAIAAN